MIAAICPEYISGQYTCTFSPTFPRPRLPKISVSSALYLGFLQKQGLQPAPFAIQLSYRALKPLRSSRRRISAMKGRREAPSTACPVPVPPGTLAIRRPGRGRRCYRRLGPQRCSRTRQYKALLLQGRVDKKVRNFRQQEGNGGGHHEARRGHVRREQSANDDGTIPQPRPRRRWTRSRSTRAMPTMRTPLGAMISGATGTRHGPLGTHVVPTWPISQLAIGIQRAKATRKT